MMHGQGDWVHKKDGVKFVGEWKDNKKCGQGTNTWPNGDKYVGQFKDNNMHGQGTYTLSDGSVKKGIWKDGELVEVQ